RRALAENVGHPVFTEIDDELAPRARLRGVELARNLAVLPQRHRRERPRLRRRGDDRPRGGAAVVVPPFLDPIPFPRPANGRAAHCQENDSEKAGGPPPAGGPRHQVYSLHLAGPEPTIEFF